MSIRFKPAALAVLLAFSINGLGGCGGEQPAVDEPVSALMSADLEHEVVRASQYPMGEQFPVWVEGHHEPQQATLKDGIALIGDVAVGQLQGRQVIGTRGQVLHDFDRPVSKAELQSAMAKGTEIAGSGIVNARNQQWPGGVIPYEFDPAASADSRAAFEGAKRDYDAKTAVRWVPRTNQADYVRIVTSNGCWSYVGRIGGRQDLSLGAGCGVNPARHELGHAVGLAHEQVRQDRDQWVIVNAGGSQNEIDRGSAGTPIGPYDFESMMHYRNYFRDGRWDYVPKNGFPPERVGNDRFNTFTPGDLNAIAAIYGPPPSSTPGGQGIALQTGQVISLQVTTPGFTNRYLRHRNSLAFTDAIDAGSAVLAKRDASFKIVAALDGTPCYSLESVNYPGEYLRHSGYRLRKDRFENTTTYRQDATFCAQTGLAGKGGVSFVSRNFPGHYIRHVNAEVFIAKASAGNWWDGGASFNADVSWQLTNPWSTPAAAANPQTGRK